MQKKLLHPQIVALEKLFKIETHPFRKVNRMINSFESTVKHNTRVQYVYL